MKLIENSELTKGLFNLLYEIKSVILLKNREERFCMAFDLNKCVNYISSNMTKKISETFGRWLEKKDNITRIQWIALYYIYMRGPQSQRELSMLMEINDSSTMRLIDRLERENWVSRVRSNEDRRVMKVILTDEGDALITKLLPIGEDFSQLLIKDIDPHELYIFQKVQQKMFDNIMHDSKSKK